MLTPEKSEQYCDNGVRPIIAIFFLVAASLFTYALQSCNGKEDFVNKKSDTVIIGCLYAKDYSGILYGGFARRIVKDTFIQRIDSSGPDKIIRQSWVRDSFYFFLANDTLKTKEPKTGVMIDSLDKNHKLLVFSSFKLYIPKEYVFPTTVVLFK